MFSCLKPPVLQKFLKIISGLLLDESAKYRHGLMGICCYLGKICIFAVTVNISKYCLYNRLLIIHGRIMA